MSLPPETEDALVALLAVRDGLVSEAVVQKLLLKSDGSKRLARLLVEAGKLSLDDKRALLERLDPEVVPGYRIEAEAGRGGMGVVYRSRQVSMDRPVALKVLSRSYSEDEDFVERFIAEARSAARLNHEHVVAAIDAGTANGLHYFVMEFVDGTSVADILDEHPIPAERTWEIAEQIAHALDHAHAKGIVHRDVKPENIMLGADGRAKLCDLGLARPAQVAGTGEKSDTTEGTPYYCSPEQALGRTDIDATSDVYSLGMTIFHMLKGEPAFDGSNAREILLQHVREPFPKLKHALPELPPQRRALLEAMVLKDRHKRLPSMRAFLERLARDDAGDEGGSPPAPGVSLKAMAAATFVACAVIGALLSSLVGAPAEPEAEPSPSPTQVAATSSPTPRPTRSAGPRRVEDEPSPAPRASVEPTDDRELEAEQALLGANRVRERGDAEAYLTALRHVVETYGDTDAGRQARDRILEQVRERQREGLVAFTQVAEQTTLLLKKDQFRAASEQVETFAGAYGDSLGSATTRLDELRALVAESGRRRWSEVRGQLATQELDQALAAVDAFAEQAPPELLAEVAAQRELLTAKVAQRAAEVALAQLLQREQDALAAGDLPGAQRLLEEARATPALSAVKAQVAAASADLTLLAEAWEACDQSVRDLLQRDDPRTRLLLAGGDELKGRVLEYDPTLWKLRIKPYGEHESQPLDLRELRPEQLLTLVLDPARGRANTLFFLARRAPAAARAALEAWTDPAGRAQLEPAVARLETAATEVEATAALRALLDAATPPQQVVDGVRALEGEVLSTRAYADAYTNLQAAYTRARAALLAADPSELFRGEFSERRGEHQLRYDFDDPAHAGDWVPDTATVSNSSASWNDHALIVRGKVRHRAVWAGGELKVEFKAASSDGDRPNINLVLGEREAWRGQLVGLGFDYGGLSRVNVSGSAPRKPGYKVGLPANVFLTLAGHPPKRDDPWMAAENEPSLLGTEGKNWRVRIERSAEGELRLRAGASRVYTLPPQADGDVPGQVTFLPFETQLRITAFTINGRLDPAWLESQVQATAQTEAAALPPPKTS